MIAQHALDDTAQVRCRLEVAAFIKAGNLQSRPIRNHPSAVHRAAGKQRDRASAMIGAIGAVDTCGAAELGGDHNHRIFPALAEAAFEFCQRAVETRQQLRETADRPALIGMGIPAIESQRRDARAVICRHQPRRTFCREAHRIHTGPRLHALVARRNLVDLQALRQRRRQRRIAMGIEIHQTHRGVVCRLR